MQEKVSTLQMRQKLGDLLNRVSLRHDEFVVERKGRPLAAVVPIEKLQQLEKLARLSLRDALRTRGRGLSQKESDLLADQAKHLSRSKKRNKS